VDLIDQAEFVTEADQQQQEKNTPLAPILGSTRH
jgi:hypothetical protein